ncbi:DUF2917 domain-containing protein [Phreatobacter stygius]|uniref:DUF2917 domain-containing protein n=1 Tax=Phreatobacter stygius TaxID=1940610 RepID=A0A4D7B056_9HYPH|nr:DUF2917 domain-containing protein [Phreatobacter stygius]QCI66999.1 DUF2917 domain-containing protein [Phreatobacter stygius]
MVCLSNDALIHLERGGLVRLGDSAGATVACLEGAVWITQDNDRRDIVLTGGDSYVVESSGLTVVCAIAGPASLTVGKPVVVEPVLVETLHEKAA